MTAPRTLDDDGLLMASTTTTRPEDEEKRPAPSELENIPIARKSIVAKIPIKKGEVFSVFSKDYFCRICFQIKASYICMIVLSNPKDKHKNAELCFL